MAAIDVGLLSRGVVGGLLGTAVMTFAEAPVWRRWGMTAVMQWHENQAVASRLLGRPVEALVAQGLLLHFTHGTAAAVVFVLVGLPLLPTLPALALGISFGFVLWLITLGIHEPITGVDPWKHPRGYRPLALSLADHLLYGAILGSLVGWP